MGNSRPVAMKHDLQVTDEHFERAAQAFGALQNPVQHSAEGPRKASQPKEAKIGKLMRNSKSRSIGRCRTRTCDPLGVNEVL